MGECGNASRVESCTSGGDQHLQEVYGVFSSSLGCATPSASNLNSERTVYTHSYPELGQTVIFTFARFPPSCHAQWTACGSLDIQVYLGGARYGMQLVGLLCLTSLQRLAGMHRPAPLGPAFWAF